MKSREWSRSLLFKDKLFFPNNLTERNAYLENFRGSLNNSQKNIKIYKKKNRTLKTVRAITLCLKMVAV